MHESGFGPNHRRLSVWLEACDLAAAVYLMCRSNGGKLDTGLIDQLRRAAVSVPSNIAEGNAKGSNRDALKFLYIARGSLAELETQMVICAKVGLLAESDVRKIAEHCNRVGRQLGGLIRYRNSRPD